MIRKAAIEIYFFFAYISLSTVSSLSFSFFRALSSTNPCDPEYYYQDIDAITTPLEEIANLISGHTVVTYDECWDAMKDIDEDADDSDLITLVYSERSVAKNLSGIPSGWNREHVWPKSYGVGYTGPDFSDLHHLYPADWNVNSARGNKYFGECSPDENDDCTSPAHSEVGPDTAASPALFQPPRSIRGDIARALFYMALRYDGDEANTENLRLSDCPCSFGREMGLRRTLLTWHENDPVSSTELTRTDAICRRYQGNRNPFVDMPDLAYRLLGNNSRSASVDASACAPCVESRNALNGSSSQCNNASLFFSSVVEGSSYNKMLEIFNPSSSSTFHMSRGGFSIQYCTNGCEDGLNFESQYLFEEDVSIGPFETLVVCHASFDDRVLPNGVSCDVRTGHINFNGDDYFALTCDDVNGTHVLDAVGAPALVTGDNGWDVCEHGLTSIENLVMTRVCDSVMSGTNDWDTSRGLDADNGSCRWKLHAPDNLTAIYSANPCASNSVIPIYSGTEQALQSTTERLPIVVEADFLSTTENVVVTELITTVETEVLVTTRGMARGESDSNEETRIASSQMFIVLIALVSFLVIGGAFIAIRRALKAAKRRTAVGVLG